MNTIKKVERVLNRFGRTVNFPDSPTNTWKALIQPLRYKNKMYLRGIPTDIGYSDDGYYLYVGPADRSLVGNDDLRIETDDCGYIVDKTESVFIGNEAIYIWAIIRKEVI